MNRNGGQKPTVEASRSDSATNTPSNSLLCSGCRRKLRGCGDAVLLKEYMKSIDYINYCHSVMNQFLERSNEKTPGLPQVPNFCAMFMGLCGSAFETVEAKKTFKHELDNIESLDQIYSCIDSLDVGMMKERLQKDSSDSDIEPDPLLVINKSRDSPASGFSSEDDPSRDVKDKKIKVNSNIPRPVNDVSQRRKASPLPNDAAKNYVKPRRASVKMKINQKNKTKLHEVKESKSSALRMLPRQDSRRSHPSSHAMLNVPNNSIQLSQEDLNQFANELLGSCSETPISSPRTTISTNSRSPSPKIRKPGGAAKITYKTRSDHNLKATKLKTKPSLVRQSTKTHKKRAITICEPHECATKTHKKGASNMATQPSPPSIPKRGSAPGKIALMKRESRSQPSVKVTSEGKYDDSDIEPDESRMFSMLMVRDSLTMKQENSLTGCMPWKQDTRGTEEIITKVCFTDSESERDPKMHSESDIDEKVFESRPIPDKHNPKVNNAYNMLKMSMSRPLSNSVVSNIGILAHSGKVRPEKMLCSRAQDKHSSSFRQPRSKMGALDDITRLSPRMITQKSSRSSGIRSEDEEEICSHRMDIPAISSYKCHY